MRINNNLMAMNTHRQLGISTNGGAKSMEKLSSGFRINRAGDDAAGLAISEKMRGQIRGLTQASRNAQDGISLIQTAEGALNETHAILQRMRELAVQSSTDTNTNDDRLEIQKEIDQLATEITRISTDTEFNTMKLLDGSFDDKKFHIGANTGQNTELQIKNMGAEALGVTRAAVAEIDGSAITASEAVKATKDFGNVTVTALEEGAKGNDIEFETVLDATGGSGGDGNNVELSVSVVGDKITVTLATDGTGASISTADDIANAINAHKDASKLVKAEVNKYKYGADGKLVAEAAVTGANLAGGADAVNAVDDRDAVAADPKLGINVSDQKAANGAITLINNALQTVSAERSKLGAMQNRLEHTIKNLDTSAENLQASEARIRDVDMAKEMMEQTKQNILQQASTAMLAQANQAPQTVLQLLR